MPELLTELRDLRGQLSALNRERNAIEERIAALITEIAGEAVLPPSSAPAPETTGEMILSAMNVNPGAVFTASDLAQMWEGRGGASIVAFRIALSRLAAKGKIRRVRFGAYSANPSSIAGD